MTKSLQAIRGMNDLLPEQSALWQLLEGRIIDLLQSHGYAEIRTPIVEPTSLFARTIGEITDIVEKEMYTFLDRNGDSLTLRPEGTASVVRAGIQHGLLHNQVQKLWYRGPMFRHERPQKGRYRQFHQIGAEWFGIADPLADVEMIAMTALLWQQLGLAGIRLELNSLGDQQARAHYRALLVDYLSDHREQLDEDSRRRLSQNPLRILDSKNPAMQALITGAPSLTDHLDQASTDHFAQVREMLDDFGIQYRVNPRLVRGLDYYNRTVFEWITDQLGAQGTVCAGGRYDGLVEQLGGRSTPAIGFAMGLERLAELMAMAGIEAPAAAPLCLFIGLDTPARHQAMRLRQRCRIAHPGLRLELDMRGGNPGKQLQRAARAGAISAAIIGEQELHDGSVQLKHLASGKQTTVTQNDLADCLSKLAQDPTTDLFT